MVFSDALFLLLFLPFLLLAHLLVPRKQRNLLLLVASLVFYTLGEGLFVLLMLSSVSVNFILGRLIERAKNEHRTPLLALGVCVNLAALVAFKYTNFIVDSLNPVLAAVGFAAIEVAYIPLPIGISFFTFECISYLIDVYRKEVRAERNPLDLALFVALFPHLVAGPILRYADLAAQIRERTLNLARFASGVERFTVGLGKKVLIANPAGLKADLVFALPHAELGTPVAWLGVGCYMVQIYFDFSGYSDMAIGLGRMFGFELCENFNYPYVARSITEFWRRWHISLSTWFRDYLYIPLGGNRGGRGRTYFNLATVFLLCGLWHGASWNFLIWGALHGTFLIIERAGLGARLETIPRALCHVYTLLVVALTWVFFRAETLPSAVAFLSALTGFSQATAYAQPLSFFIDGELVVVGICAVLGSTSIPKRLFERSMTRMPRAVGACLSAAGLAAVLLGSLANVAAGSYSPFIYLRF